MQRGPKNMKSTEREREREREGLDTEGLYTSKAHNRQKLRKQNPDTLNQHKQGPDTEGTKTFTSKAHNRQDLRKQSPDTWNLHKQSSRTDRTYTNRAKTPSKFK